MIHYILSYHSGIKLELNSKRNYRKYGNTYRLNNTLLNGQRVIEEITGGRGKSKSSWNKTKIKTQPTRIYGPSKDNAKGKSLYLWMSTFNNSDFK
jgi:hypothetical protein